MESSKTIHNRIELAEKRYILPRIHVSEAKLDAQIWEVGGEPVTYETAMAATYMPTQEGATWGCPWDTAWLKLSGKVPAEWAGQSVVALIDLSFDCEEGFGRESLVWDDDGKPVIAVSRNRKTVPLFESAKGGEDVALTLEAAANPQAEWHFGIPDHEKTDGKTPLFKIKKLRLVTYDPEAYQLLMDFRVCRDAWQKLDENSTRWAQLRRGLDEACRLMENGNSHWIPAARARLKPLLECTNGSSMHQIIATGHAHIDTAWCWPLRETIRKCARTFSTALAYMKEHPDYHFSCSQPAQYLWMKEYYPSIYADIKEAVKRGQWEVVGSMWVEPDCNIPSGESLVRQVIHGKRFFQEEFGVETKDLWLPDVFGYSAALPQILRKSGVDWFLTQKISWNDTNIFPHNTFNWQGLDGTQIFSHFPPVDTYNARITTDELKRAEVQFKQKDQAKHSLMPFGQGDGGGGTTIEMIERCRRFNDFEGLSKVKMGTVTEFFEKAEAELKDPPLWVGELYLELHRGTYTSQAWNKYNNRRCERLLRDAEFFDVIASILQPGELLDGDPSPERAVYDVDGHQADKNDSQTAQSLDRAWKLLLLNQFHDILPGSSIEWVYRDSDRDYKVIEALAAAVQDAALDRLMTLPEFGGEDGEYVVFNTLSQARSELIELPDGGRVLAEVPACGYARVNAAESNKLPEAFAPVNVKQDKEGIHVENGLVSFTLTQNGKVSTIIDLEQDEEFLTEAGNEFHLLHDYPNLWNVWDIEGSAMNDFDVVDTDAAITIVESSPIRVVLGLEVKFGKSTLQQQIILQAGSKRIDFNSDLDWQERDRVLKVSFPTTINTDMVTCEIQHGHVRRNAHRNTSWDAARFEICAHRWVDLSDTGRGFALLNDGKFGHDIENGRMRLSLVKGGHAPDPKADIGKHRFSYSVMPHIGGPVDAKVMEEGYALNSPVILRPVTQSATAEARSEHSWVKVDQSGLVLEALKKTEDGSGYVVRFNEAAGTAKTAKVEFGLPLSIEEEIDLMERPLAEPVATDAENIRFKSFDLRTFRASSK